MIRSRRIGLAHTTLALFALAILFRAAKVQLIQGSDWRARAERQQAREQTVPAPRGEVLDATRRVLAQSRDMVRLEISPREVSDPAKVRKALDALQLDQAVISRALDTTLKWVTIPGRFLAVDAAPALGLRGVYATPSIIRTYALSEETQRLVGHVDTDNKPVDGLELALDSILRGTPGSATLLRDTRGQSRESPTTPGTAPKRGYTVVLTVVADLQEIAEKALADAVAKMNAEGGDIVILDPHDGEVLAMASHGADSHAGGGSTAVTEPFEPGSTLKPFIAAGLLEHGRVQDADSVDTGDGVLVIKGRSSPIHDEHKIGKAPLADVLRWSSNIGIVKFSERLTPREEFETLRDFGFGTITGVPYPIESPGTLRPPKQWSQQSPYSLPMGYEIAVTPLQLATAYAAIANGGELVEPSLVKEIIAPDGSVRFRHQRRVVRRVVSKAVADKVRTMLLGVVDQGTALQAALSNYVLAGKTGTPRATVGGRYVAGRHNPNFVGMFPGDNPQYVIVVKLTAPQGTDFGGTTAAPVTKAILEAALAARDAALDRGKLKSSALGARRSALGDSVLGARHSALAGRGGGAESREPSAELAAVPYVVRLPLTKEPPSPAAPPRAVPDVRGLALRDAVRSLHSAGFHVQVAGTMRGTGSASSTSPAAGELAPSGSLVRLHFDN